MLPLISEMFLTGVVESVDDPLRLGRVAVRYLKIHTDSLNRLPTSMLPWSNVMGTINSAAISGVGVAPVGMVPGTMVYALPLDDGYQEFPAYPGVISILLDTLTSSLHSFVSLCLCVRTSSRVSNHDDQRNSQNCRRRGLQNPRKPRTRAVGKCL